MPPSTRASTSVAAANILSIPIPPCTSSLDDNVKILSMRSEGLSVLISKSRHKIGRCGAGVGGGKLRDTFFFWRM